VYDFGFRNEAEERVHDLILANELEVVITFFRKKKNYYTIFKRGRNIFKIDYFMWKRDRESE